jgi:quercetin dioxygenase-like cupin family protein
LENLFFDWKEKVVFAGNGPVPQVLVENENLKVVVAGLEAGQKIPEHPESTGVYHILEGEGVMFLDGELIPVSNGSTIVTRPGAVRGIEAKTRLAFLAARVA